MSKVVRVGSIPSDAKSEGALNETPSAEERTPQGRTVQTEGPRYNAETGSFAPAEYPLALHGLVRQDR